MNQEQLDLAARLLADSIMRSVADNAFGQAQRIIKQFNTSKPKATDKVSINFVLDIPAALLYRIHEKVTLPEGNIQRKIWEP